MKTPWWSAPPPRAQSDESPYIQGPLWCIGPCGHVAYLRVSDGAIYCDQCGSVTYPSPAYFLPPETT